MCWENKRWPPTSRRGVIRPKGVYYRVQQTRNNIPIDNAQADNCKAQTPLIRFVVDLLRFAVEQAVQQIY